MRDFMRRHWTAILLALVLLAQLAGAIWFATPARADSCDREGLFGDDWMDLDGDGRDGREEIVEAFDRGGWWLDPYDGDVVEDSGLLDLDHVVPLCLAVAWGADDWPEDLRHRFANDPLNLILVGRSANRSKGDRPPSDWMPRNGAFWGPYLAQMGSVIDKYPLEVPDGEFEALECYGRFVRDTGKGFRPLKWGCR